MSRIVLTGDGAAERLRAMIKFMILFGPPEDAESFENVYQDFLALVERMPNILRRQVVHVTGSPLGAPEIYRILELYFESTASQNAALYCLSAGQEAGKELQRLPTGAYQLLHADVYEEEGGSTPQAGCGQTIPLPPMKTAADAADGRLGRRPMKQCSDPVSPLKRRVTADSFSPATKSRFCRHEPGAAISRSPSLRYLQRLMGDVAHGDHLFKFPYRQHLTEEFWRPG